MKKTPYFVIVVFLLVACGRNIQGNKLDNARDTLIRKEYYSNKVLKRELYKRNDTITYKYYARDGILENKMLLFNGSLENQDKMNALVESYYKNGNVNSKGYLADGEAFGEGFEFYENGKIKMFSFSLNNKDYKYVREYDTSGNITREEGKPLIRTYGKFVLDKFNDCNDCTFYVGDTFRVYYDIGLLPEWDMKLTTVWIDDETEYYPMFSIDNNKLRRRYYGKCVSLQTKCRSIGNKKWVTNIKITDNKYHSEINYGDTINFEVK